MSLLRISFIKRSAYGVISSNSNLIKWGRKDDPSCLLCNGKQTLEHLLSFSKKTLLQGRYTWGHNQLLKVRVKAIEFNIAHIWVRRAETTVVFRYHSVGQKIRVPLTKIKEGAMACADDLECIPNLPGKCSYPEVIKKNVTKARLCTQFKSCQNHVPDRADSAIRMHDWRGPSLQDWEVPRLGKGIEGVWIEDKALRH